MSPGQMVMPTYMLPIAWHSAVCYVGRKRWIMRTSFHEIFLSRMLGSFLILLENNVWKSAWSLFCYIMRPHWHSLTVAKWELWIEKSYRAEEKLPYSKCYSWHLQDQHKPSLHILRRIQYRLWQHWLELHYVPFSLINGKRKLRGLKVRIAHL